MSNLFNTKRGIKGLSILLSGFILLSVLGLFVFNYYKALNRRNIDFNSAKQEVITWALRAQHTHNRQLRNHIQRSRKTWMHIGISRNPLADAPVITSDNIWQLKQTLDKQQDKVNVSLQLPTQGYLNFHGVRPDHTWQNMALLCCVIILLICLLLICYWVIQYISTPLEPLIQAIERFSNDINAPAIHPFGAPEMQVVIATFNNLQNNIKTLIDDRTKMLAAISHDLRTPITRLKLRAENIDDEKLQTKVLADLNDMEQMITSILAFARGQNADESWQTFDLNALLESICHDQSDMGKDVVYETNCERLSFNGRLLGLKRAFTNLIDNAIKYGKSCVVTLSNEANSITISIQDQGPGIPEDKFESVFKPFYRVDNARTPTIPGSGLGLAVTQDVMKAHSGKIQLSNTCPGLCIRITLPKSHF